MVLLLKGKLRKNGKLNSLFLFFSVRRRKARKISILKKQVQLMIKQKETANKTMRPNRKTTEITTDKEKI